MNSTVLWILLGIVIIGGGVVAFAYTSNTTATLPPAQVAGDTMMQETATTSNTMMNEATSSDAMMHKGTTTEVMMRASSGDAMMKR